MNEQDLRSAARFLEKRVLETLPDPEDCPASFSPAFEKKMKRLILRTDRPVRYWLTRILAVLVPVGLIALGALLSSGRAAPEPPPAREPAPTVEPAPAPAVIYRPTWLPEGCELLQETLYGSEGMITYRTAGGAEAFFLYSADGAAAEGLELEDGTPVTVGDLPGVLRLAPVKGELHDLFWSGGEDGPSFWLSAPYTEELLLQIAESVEAFAE